MDYSTLTLEELQVLFHEEIRAAVTLGRQRKEGEATEALKRANLIKIQIRANGGHV